MAQLSDIVNITITAQTAQALQAGFGNPLILVPHNKYTDRIRTYVNPADLLTDGWLVTDAVYKAAVALTSQNPRPPSFQVGRQALFPTQRFVLVPTVTDSTLYSVTVDGLVANFTSGVGTTATLICAGLKTAIDALSLAITTTATTTLTITATVAGDFHSVQVADVTRLQINQNHADPGVATDLAAIALVDNSWYCILHTHNSDAVVSALAAYAEANFKIYVGQTQSSDILGSGTADIASTLKTALYTRTATLYHPKTDAFADMGWAGNVLPNPAGSETWAYKSLAGVPTVVLTANQRTNALGKNANVYETLAGLNITEFGKVSSGSYLDITRGKDWLQSRMQTRIFSKLSQLVKIPFTDQGIAIVEAEIRAQLKEGIDQSFLAANPAPTVTVPLAASVSAANKQARLLPNVTFQAVLAGAIHTVTINGVVSL